MSRHRSHVRYAGSILLALLAAGCGDSAGPTAGSTKPNAALAAGSTGIALDQRNGTFNESGTQLLKGFNPTNPQLGDAIVATFFWVGSTNVITQVHDRLTDGTVVGNQYALVEYVTSGGISMATYVALNVGNFPLADPMQAKILVVQAELSAPVTDGGVQLAAFSGVSAVQALDVHRSAFGSGNQPITVGPGAVTASAGALVYGVTLSNGMYGISPPDGFTAILPMSDNFLNADGEFLVTSAAGAVDPKWTWWFGSTSTWLASAVVLIPSGQESAPVALYSSSCTVLTCQFDGSASSAHAGATYAWDFGDGSPAGSGVTTSHAYAAGGTYTATLTVTDDRGPATVSHVLNVATLPLPTANFTVACTSLSCSVNASTSVTQPGATFAWGWGDGSAAGSGVTASHAYAAAGSFTITLTVTDAAGVGTKTQAVTVAPPPVPTASFTFTCTGLTCSFNGGGSTAQSGATYGWNWGNGTSSGTGVTPSHTFAANGTYTVTLSVTDIGGTGTTSRAVTVLFIPPPTPSFTFSCTYLVCSFNASGSVAQPNATYAWRWGDNTSNGSGVTPSHTYSSAGTRSVRLTVTDAGGSRNLTQSVTTQAPPNQAPVVNAGSDRTTRVSQLPFRLSASFTDADGRSPYAYVITWGNGTQSTGSRTSTGSFNVSHSYARVAGSYVVTVTVRDAAGAAGSDTMTLTVTP